MRERDPFIRLAGTGLVCIFAVAGDDQSRGRGAADAGEGDERCPFVSLRRLVAHRGRDPRGHAPGTHLGPAPRGRSRTFSSGGRGEGAGYSPQSPRAARAGTCFSRASARGDASGGAAGGCGFRPTRGGGARFAGGFPEAVEVTVVASANFARGGHPGQSRRRRSGSWPAWRPRGPGRMLLDAPVVVIGFGGYPAIPAMSAGLGAQGAPRSSMNRTGCWEGSIAMSRGGSVAGGPAAPGPTAAGRRVRRRCIPATPVAAQKGGARPGRERISSAPGDLTRVGSGEIGKRQSGARIFSQVVPGALAALPGTIRAICAWSHQRGPRNALKAAAGAYSAGGDRRPDVPSPSFRMFKRRMSEGRSLSSAGAGHPPSADLDGDRAARRHSPCPFAAPRANTRPANRGGASWKRRAAVWCPRRDFAPAVLAEEVEPCSSANPDTANGEGRRAALGHGRPTRPSASAALVDEGGGGGAAGAVAATTGTAEDMNAAARRQLPTEMGPIHFVDRGDKEWRVSPRCWNEHGYICCRGRTEIVEDHGRWR